MDTHKVYRSEKSYRRPGSKRKRSFCGNRYTDENGTEHTSTSAKKLKKSNDTSFDVKIDGGGYSILQFVTVFAMLSQWSQCVNCKEKMSFAKYGMRGVGFKVCVTCGCGDRYINSCGFPIKCLFCS